MRVTRGRAVRVSGTADASAGAGGSGGSVRAPCREVDLRRPATPAREADAAHRRPADREIPTRWHVRPRVNRGILTACGISRSLWQHCSPPPAEHGPACTSASRKVRRVRAPTDAATASRCAITACGKRARSRPQSSTARTHVETESKAVSMESWEPAKSRRPRAHVPACAGPALSSVTRASGTAAPRPSPRRLCFR